MSHVPCNPMETPSGRQGHFEDEGLESIWEMRELDGKVLYEHLKKTLEDVKQMGHKDNAERLGIMENKGLYSVEDAIESMLRVLLSIERSSFFEREQPQLVYSIREMSSSRAGFTMSGLLSCGT